MISFVLCLTVLFTIGECGGDKWKPIPPTTSHTCRELDPDYKCPRGSHKNYNTRYELTEDAQLLATAEERTEINQADCNTVCQNKGEGCCQFNIQSQICDLYGGDDEHVWSDVWTGFNTDPSWYANDCKTAKEWSDYDAVRKDHCDAYSTKVCSRRGLYDNLQRFAADDPATCEKLCGNYARTSMKKGCCEYNPDGWGNQCMWSDNSHAEQGERFTDHIQSFGCGHSAAEEIGSAVAMTTSSAGSTASSLVVNVFAALGLSSILYGAFRHYTQK